ncbi:MAG: hypothetical protein QS99_C0015G0025 [archaeon GW2011_AR4]|nr:MAG: hypothetical protein QS99_C0015G0025 [archaeon GW2011_AR4]
MVYNTYITSKEQFLKKSTDSFFAMLQEKGVGIDDAIRLLEKRKKELEKETLTIPVCIFSHDKLSGLESITKYLKEEKGLSYHEIAVMLGRDDRTIWHACHQATLKMPELLPSKGRKDIAIPVRIFKERKVSVLEHIASYLKQTHGLTYHEIAALLHRDDRTIWTVISRAQKKGVRYG